MSRVTPAQRAAIDAIRSASFERAERRKRIRAERSAAKNRRANKAATVEAFVANGGQIEVLPPGASGNKQLRFDHSGGRALIKREFRLYP